MGTTDILSLGKSTLGAEIRAMESVMDRLDDSFTDMVRIILNECDRLVVCGVGKSGLIGRKIASTLASTGTRSLFLHPTEAAHGDLGMLGSGDMLLLISKSGESSELLHLIPAAERLDLPILSLVGRAKSTLARASRVAITIEVEEEACPLNLAPTSSTLCTLAVGDALAITLMQLSGFGERDFALRHPAGALGNRLLLRVSDLMWDSTDVPFVRPEDGFPATVAAITSGALGAVCVVDDGGSLQGLITDGDIRRALDVGPEIFSSSAAEIMTSDPVTVASTAKAVEALALMEDRPSQINVLPVVSETGRWEGLLRLHDLVNVPF